ncbi:hypothetical protein L7F22_025517 [Adiantum nelumboides]|nr:hypothetical protein [Adiantum nelumboides]
MLKSFDNDISADTLVMIFFSMIKEELLEDVQDEVFIIDYQILYLLDERKPPQELLSWFTYCSPSATLIILPYVSRNHWSLVMLDMQEKVALYFSYVEKTTHLDIKGHINILIATIESFHALGCIFKDIIHRNIQVPQQQDNHKCGWHMIYNAKVMLNHDYNIETLQLLITTYIELDVAQFCMDKIESMMDTINAKSWSHCKDCLEEKLEFDKEDTTDEEL